MTARDWDGEAYHRISGPMEAMALPVLDRLVLRGDETVLDAGCGSGRVTRHLVNRLPSGRVVALDAAEDMVAVARDYLGDAVDFVVTDLLELDLAVLGRDAPVDAVFSTATFHHVADHDLLFRRLAGVLVQGGQLVAQCGGEGNVAAVVAAAREVASDHRFADGLAGVDRQSNYQPPDATERCLRVAGFTDVRCWLAPNPVVPDDPVEYLEKIVLGGHAQRLGAELGHEFIVAVADRLAASGAVTIDYVRLNIDARRA